MLQGRLPAQEWEISIGSTVAVSTMHCNIHSRLATELLAIPALRRVAYGNETTFPHLARQIPAKFSDREGRFVAAVFAILRSVISSMESLWPSFLHHDAFTVPSGKMMISEVYSFPLMMIDPNSYVSIILTNAYILFKVARNNPFSSKISIYPPF